VSQDIPKPPAPVEPRVRAPEGLVAWRFDVEGDAFAVFECRPARPRVQRASNLTPAECDVVSLIAQGLSNTDIARRRGSRPRTVANQLANIFRKLRVCSRLEVQACVGRGE
jgi:DNA-binding NarL/FixJ family response regulator